MTFRSPILALLFSAAMAGCGAVGSTIDGCAVTGKCLVYATLRSDGHEAAVNLGGKKVQVTASQITWAGGGSLQLPEKWNRLELAETFDSVEVSVDGQKFAAIQPTR